MEITQRLQKKIEQYQKALKGFKDLLALDLRSYEGVVLDGLQNGLIQKFAVCAELTWKLIKLYLLAEHQIDARTPKSAIKEFYLAGLADSGLYEKLIQMQDDRNSLSHMYSEAAFQKILGKLRSHENSMEAVLAIISRSMTAQG